MDILNKLYLFVFILSTLNILRHCYYFIQAWFSLETETPRKYIISDKKLIILGLSISFFLTTIITGFKIF
jgi:hypothetical protein